MIHFLYCPLQREKKHEDKNFTCVKVKKVFMEEAI